MSARRPFEAIFLLRKKNKGGKFRHLKFPRNLCEILGSVFLWKRLACLPLPKNGLGCKSFNIQLVTVLALGGLKGIFAQWNDFHLPRQIQFLLPLTIHQSNGRNRSYHNNENRLLEAWANINILFNNANSIAIHLVCIQICF